jgi:L-aspartate oxidase
VFARRAITHALAEPARARPEPSGEDLTRLRSTSGPPGADRDTREALWRHAGIERTREGLQALLRAAHPLVPLIARCALARTESRGAHQRRDHPQRDPALDHRHVVVEPGGETSWQTWT